MTSWAGLLAVGLLALFGCAPAPAVPRKRPNIVLLVSDDQGYAELRCQGGDLPTPNLDRLAASGIRFTAGYVTCPFCSPSRAGLLTGRYQQRFGHENNPVERMNDRPEVGLPVDEVTLADRLKGAGYATGMTGKWHLGVHPPQHPQKRGFDEFYGFLREGHFYLPPPYDGDPSRVVSHLRPREPEYDRENPILRGREPVQESRYLTNAIGQEAVAFIERHADAPFFLYVPFNAPHSPMQASPADYDRAAGVQDPHRRVWAAMMAAMDDAVGSIREALRRRGIDQDTIIFFLSDNGGPTTELTSRNDPFSGGKGSLLEGGIRVPFMASWPGRWPAGRVDARPVISLDIVPTALAAAGVASPSGLDGVDLGPRLEGHAAGDVERTLYWRMGGQSAVRRGRWKLMRAKATEPYRLYDLDLDPGERQDQSVSEPQLAAGLAAALETWSRSLAPPRW
jgi:arylsulfatase B